MTLTAEQQAAVDSDSSSLLLIAGAGTGKSTVLVNRAARLVESGIDPKEIMVVTFSREAASSLSHRLAVRNSDLSRCLVGTFHSLAFDLMPVKPVVLDEDTTIERLAGFNALTSKPASIGDLACRKDHPSVQMFLSRMKLAGESDYTGLLEWLRDNTDTLWIKHILVDEAQDNDPIQWEIVNRFAAAGVSVFCVMDPRQQIYEWRGATYQPGLQLQDHLYLTQSFRLKQDVAQLSNALAKEGVPDVQLPPIVGMREGAAIERVHREDKITGQTAILCRTNRTVDRIAKDLAWNGIEHTVIRRKPKQLAPLVNYLATGGSAPNILNQVAFPDLSGNGSFAKLKLEKLRREYTDPRDLLSAFQFTTTDLQEELQWWIKLARGCSTIEQVAQTAALWPMQTEVTSGVVVSTVHQAKGLEYETVIVPAEDYVGASPAQYRLSLVQVTRAKQNLFVMFSPGHLSKTLDALGFGL